MIDPSPSSLASVTTPTPPSRPAAVAGGSPAAPARFGQSFGAFVDANAGRDTPARADERRERAEAGKDLPGPDDLHDDVGGNADADVATDGVPPWFAAMTLAAVPAGTPPPPPAPPPAPPAVPDAGGQSIPAATVPTAITPRPADIDAARMRVTPPAGRTSQSGQVFDMRAVVAFQPTMQPTAAPVADLAARTTGPRTIETPTIDALLAQAAGRAAVVTAKDATPRDADAGSVAREAGGQTIVVSTVPQPAAHVFAGVVAAATAWRDRAQADRDLDTASIPLAAAAPAEIRDHATVLATGDARGAALDLTHDTGLQSMIDRIATLRDDVKDSADTRDTRIRLMPDALGSVDVAVRREGDRIAVRFTAEHEATRALIAEAQPRLTELAAARGVRIGDTSVGTGSGSDARQQQQRAPAPAPFRPRAPDTTVRGTPTTDQRLA